MKLVRYGPAGKEKPGLIDAQGVLRDLSRKVKDIDAATLAPSSLAALKKLDPKKLPAVKGKPRLGPCVATPSKFVAIGLNYLDHARETGSPIPEYPVVFYKTPSCIVGATDNIIVPRDSTQLDWEVELGVVIGRTARYVEEKDALRYVAGYCVVNDVSERDARRCAGRDQVAGQQRHILRHIGDECGHVEDHGPRVAGLPPLTIDIEPHVEVLHVLDFVGRDEPRSRRTERIATFTLAPL